MRTLSASLPHTDYSRWPWAIRGLVLLVLAMAEIVGLSIRFDTASLAATDASWALALDQGPQVLMAVTAAVAALGILLAPRLGTHLHQLAESRTRGDWILALALHLGFFIAFALLGVRVFEHAADTGAALALLWLLLGLAAATTWLLALAPGRHWLRLATAEWPTLAIAALVGTLAWGLGTLLRGLWAPLGDATFTIARALLEMFFPLVTADPTYRVLGANGFSVVINAECSGYEGMALIATFLALYLYRFRAELRLSRALFLIPAGILVIWVLNSVRIAALIALGASYSPEVALGGFHSQAGWISFILVALAMTALAHRSRLFVRGTAAVAVDSGTPDVRPRTDASRTATALLAPWLVLMAFVIVGSAFTHGLDWFYPVRVVTVGAVLWIFRGIYMDWDWGWSWTAFGIGASVFAMWLLLVPVHTPGGTALAEQLGGLAPSLAVSWIGFRVIGSIVVIPLAEELAFRGYLLGRLASGHSREVPTGRFTWPSLLVSSLCFGVLHGDWIAGSLAGAGYALALYHRGRLADAVLAHMTTNILITVAVLGAGYWGLWA